MGKLNKTDISICKKITKNYGTSYFISTYFFPKIVREKTWILYAFVRFPDEIVDTEEKNSLVASEKLIQWRDNWQKAFNGEIAVNPILTANAKLWHENNIPFEYSKVFLDAMMLDTKKNRYETYNELEEYMQGSATVIGYMMSYIMGFRDGALPYAKALGEAFQLTNFLRDIKEDFDRGRIYIPTEDMDAYRVSEKDFSDIHMSENMKKLILFEINRNEELYQKALIGIPYLDKKCQRAVRIALYLYKEIADQIKENPEHIFRERVRVSDFRKIIIILKNF